MKKEMENGYEEEEGWQEGESRRRPCRRSKKKKGVQPTPRDAIGGRKLYQNSALPAAGGTSSDSSLAV